LSQPVDVYSEWVDACDQIAKETQEGPGGRPSAAHRNGRRDSEGELEGDFIEHDEDDHDADGVEDDDY
jgi:transcription elongation factor Elf1